MLALFQLSCRFLDDKSGSHGIPIIIETSNTFNPGEGNIIFTLAVLSITSSSKP